MHLSISTTSSPEKVKVDKGTLLSMIATLLMI